MLDEIHRLERVRDQALLDVVSWDIEFTDETARRIVHRVENGESVASAERRVASELTETRRRLLTARSIIDRSTNQIEHYRYLIAHLPTV